MNYESNVIRSNLIFGLRVKYFMNKVPRIERMIAIIMHEVRDTTCIDVG